MTEPKALKDRIRKHFAAQARMSPKAARARHPENVVPMIDLADPRPSDRLLDIACGWGFVVLEYAPRVAKATGLDLTPEMVALARTVAADRGVNNVDYVVGDVEDLQFSTASFDLVTCRFSFHHFPDPDRALHEMKRVLTPDGRLVLYDFVASADEKKAAKHNEIEQLRDPCHVKVHSGKEFQALFRKCGLVEDTRITTLWKRDFDVWMKQVGARDDLQKKVRKRMVDTQEGNQAGLGVRVRGGNLTFTHNCVAWRLNPKR